MIYSYLKIFTLIAALCGLLAISLNDSNDFEPFKSETQNKSEDISKMSVEEVLVSLGDEKPLHYIEIVDPDSARMGEEMVRIGHLKDGSNSRISKFFLCTDCHNQVKETEYPSDESPEALLEYSKKTGLPFLQGSTFYGMYNKRHWYNGDYEKKYGDLVKDTRDTLANAIQLCATQCSQGREMVDWEIRCVIHYFKTLEYKIGDFNINEDEVRQIEKSLVNDKSSVIKLLKSKYSEKNPATFGTSEIPEIEGYEPLAENGRVIYENGCVYCHAPHRNISHLDLGMNKLSFKFLNNNLYAYDEWSIPHITRYGTYAVNGRREYMPMYTMENMSDEQLLDLIHFVKTKAEE